MINKNMKPGYQGASDVMRSNAEKMMSHPGNIPDVIMSESAPSRIPVREYKSGGSCNPKKERQNYINSPSDPIKRAFGGSAKIRHGEATEAGKPINPAKSSYKKNL